jgi:hypothetical protein
VKHSRPQRVQHVKPVVLARVIACAVLSMSAGRGQTVKTDELPADTLIVLQRGACEHRCPVYKVAIFSDGSAIFDGRSYVRRAETVRTRLALDAIGKLLGEAKAAGFFDLADRYLPDAAGCETPKSDAPTAILSISAGGKAKTIVHYRGCGGPDSARLTQLEDHIDLAVNSARWVK